MLLLVVGVLNNAIHYCSFFTKKLMNKKFKIYKKLI